MDHSNSQSPGRPASSKDTRNQKRAPSNSPESALSKEKSKQVTPLSVVAGEMVKKVGSEVEKDVRLEGWFHVDQAYSFLNVLFDEMEKWLPINQPISALWNLYSGPERELVAEIGTTRFDSTEHLRKSIASNLVRFFINPHNKLFISVIVDLKDGKPSLRQQVFDLKKKIRELEEKVQEDGRKNQRICEKMERHASVIELAAGDLKSYVADSRI